jgi:thiol-disulfide isomerase/thioredoxin
LLVGTVTEVLSKSDFDSSLESAGDSLVVLDIGSTKCGPCKMVWPKFVALSEEFENQAVFLKINGDTNKETVVRAASHPFNSRLCLAPPPFSHPLLNPVAVARASDDDEGVAGESRSRVSLLQER